VLVFLGCCSDSSSVRFFTFLSIHRDTLTAFIDANDEVNDCDKSDIMLRLYLGQVLTKDQGELLPRFESGLPCGNDVQTLVML
jgi:hypothetical protein